MGALVVLENKDFGPNGLIAVPEKLYSGGPGDAFYNPGRLTSIAEDAFYQQKSCVGCIPIKAAESLDEPKQEYIDAIVKYGIDSMNKHAGFDIDADAVMNNEHFNSILIDSGRVDAIAYRVKFTGEYRGPLKVPRDSIWNAIFLAGAGDDIRLANDNTVLELNGKPSDLRTVSNEYGYLYYGTLKLFKAGELKLHRGSLKPYKKSDSSIAKSYENGPWILLDKKGSYLKRQTK